MKTLIRTFERLRDVTDALAVLAVIVAFEIAIFTLMAR